MLYNVIGLKKKVVPAGKMNAGQPYVEVKLEEPTDGEIRLVPVFDVEAKRYLDLIPTVAVDQEVALPENAPEQIKKWPCCFDKEYIFPQPMVRVNTAGEVEKNKFGHPRVRKSILVLTRYKKDNETGELSPRKGWDLETRGTSVMNAFYIPLNATQEPEDAASMAQQAQENAAVPV